MFEVMYVVNGTQDIGKTFVVYDVIAGEDGMARFLVFINGMWVYEPSGNFLPLNK